MTIQIDKTTYRAKAANERVRFLVLHYTAAPLKGSIEALTGPNVSAHYLVPDSRPDGIFQLVDETRRAWHAGVSHWQGRDNLNDTSIGIEIVNLGFTREPGEEPVWYPFPDAQVDAVMTLAGDIVRRYGIDPTCVIGHSDIAPGRKSDPGPLFPWERLARRGVGAWPDAAEVRARRERANPNDVKGLQEKLRRYGYKIAVTGRLDQHSHDVVRAFQMHFRPAQCNGLPDAETVAILETLLDKYRR